MSITISFGSNGVFIGDEPKNTRAQKGKSLIDFPDDYTVVDLETTGLDPHFDEIIEVAAIRVRGGEVKETFSSLVKPSEEIDDFIMELTGITNEMLADAPAPEKIFPVIREFLGEDILVGHNVNFDINFLYDEFTAILKCPLTNNYIDTRRISRKALPDLNHHRLKDIVAALDVSANGAHRALADCQATYECFCKLHDHIADTGSISDFIGGFKRKSKNIDLRQITADGNFFDETHPLYGKRCVFTGALEKMTRADAAQLVVNIGGICDNNITKKTNFLILGNNDYCKSIKDGKSSKQKRAEEYKLSGIDIEIIPENVFYDMIESAFPCVLEEDAKSTVKKQADTIFKGNVEITNFEQQALQIIAEALNDVNIDIIHLERRTPAYLSVIIGEYNDFCRIKVTKLAKWFSLDLMYCKELYDDPRLKDVKNKNLRHWKINLSSIEEMKNYADLIKYSYLKAAKKL